jgi:hypothetical protein
MNYWQVAAGSRGREYSAEFLRYGLAFVGGGNNERRMDTEVNEGDLVLLKQGLSLVVAAGHVVTRDGSFKGNRSNHPKEWLTDFDGWDLASYCKVDWHAPAKPVSTQGLTRTTIEGVNLPHLRDIGREIIANQPACELEPEPGPTRQLSLTGDLLPFLVSEGLRPASAEAVTQAYDRIRLLAHYYRTTVPWEQVREHETRTFLIVPLMLALGWPEQHVKIEYPIKKHGRVDLACFKAPFGRYSASDRAGGCVLILESKGFASGLDYATGQAATYARHFPNCRLIVVSNGYCYKIYERVAGGSFALQPSAYLNLLDPRDRYPLDPGVPGAREALRALLPRSLD